MQAVIVDCGYPSVFFGYLSAKTGKKSAGLSDLVKGPDNPIVLKNARELGAGFFGRGDYLFRLAAEGPKSSDSAGSRVSEMMCRSRSIVVVCVSPEVARLFEALPPEKARASVNTP